MLGDADKARAALAALEAAKAACDAAGIVFGVDSLARFGGHGNDVLSQCITQASTRVANIGRDRSVKLDELNPTIPCRVDFENVREVTIPARVDSVREAGPAPRVKGTSKKPVAVVSASSRPRYGTVWIMCKSRSVLLAATEAATAAHAENTYELNDDGVSAVVTVNGGKNTGGAALRWQIRAHRVPEARDAAKKILREAGYRVQANGTERDLG